MADWTVLIVHVLPLEMVFFIHCEITKPFVANLLFVEFYFLSLLSISSNLIRVLDGMY